MTVNIHGLDKSYIKSKEWKCSKSPTGSHYFIISSIKTGCSGKCKYCGKTEHYIYSGRGWRREVVDNQN